MASIIRRRYLAGGAAALGGLLAAACGEIEVRYVQGPPGPAGPAGAQGERGATGATGAQGAAGAAGQTQTIVQEKVVTVEKPVVVEKVVTVDRPVVVEKVVEKVVERAPLPALIVGQLNAFTGSLSYFGPAHRNAAALAADHVNRAGGIRGASMIILSGDTGVNPVQGVDAARALVDVENAVAIIGALASGVTLPVATSVTIPKKRLQISGASTSPAITVLEDDDYLFRTAVSDAAQGAVLARLAQEEGYQNAGIMYINNAYGEGLANQFEQTFTSLGGKVTGKVPHEDSQPSFRSELEKATTGDPDVLIAMSYPGQAEIYLRESLEGGYSDKFLFVDGTKSPEMMEAVGWERLEGSLGTAPGAPDSPQLQAFRSAYAAAHGGQEPEYPFVNETYDAAVLIALAAAKANSTTDSTAIRDAIRAVANPPGTVVGPGVEDIRTALELIANGDDINYEGAAGPVDFDEHGDVVGPIEIWKVEGGQIKSTGRFESP